MHSSLSSTIVTVGSSTGRRWRGAWLLLVAALVAALVGVRARPVLAHAILIRSDPPQNAELRTPPARLDLFFSEPVNRSLSSIHLLDGSGVPRTTGAARFSSDPTELTLDVGSLDPGYYTVSWVTVSAVDGHRWQGTYPITLLIADGSRPPGSPRPVAAGGTGPEVAPFDAALRWLLLLGLIGVAGAFGFALLVHWPAARQLNEPGRGAAREAGLRQLALIAIPAATVMLIANLAAFLRQVEQSGSLASLGSVLTARTGVAAVAREALAHPLMASREPTSFEAGRWYRSE